MAALLPHARVHWEIIADNLSKHGWSLGCVSAVDSEGRTIFVASAHRLTEGPTWCADKKTAPAWSK